MNNEKTPFSSHEQNKPSNNLEATRQAQENIDAKNIEKELNSEKSQAEHLDKARHEALEKAKEIEHNYNKEKRKATEASPEKRRGPVSKQARKEAFNKTMSEIQSEMSPASRTFSKIIHNPAIEKSSEVVGNTIARPNAILSGSVTAFILTAAIYLIAKHFGYSLSGTETIATFVLGWIIGLIYDYIRVLLFGKDK